MIVLWVGIQDSSHVQTCAQVVCVAEDEKTHQTICPALSNSPTSKAGPLNLPWIAVTVANSQTSLGHHYYGLHRRVADVRQIQLSTCAGG